MENTLIHEFSQIVESIKHKDAVIYCDGDKTCTILSFQEVLEICETINRCIVENIPKQSNCIGLIMHHNVYIPSLVLSLQKSQKAFMFFNPDESDEKTFNIIKKLNIRWIFTINNGNQCDIVLKEHVVVATTINVLGLDNLTLWNVNEQHHQAAVIVENICYIICTSGTTGNPKVIRVENHCIISNIHSLRKVLNITQDNVIYFGTPLTFDPSMVELFLCLTTGATLFITPPAVRLNATRLLNVLFPDNKISDPKTHAHGGITFLQIVPSLLLRWDYNQLENILQNSSLKILALGGEKFPESILKLKWGKDLHIFNLYGITEVSCWASVCKIQKGAHRISLGYPLDDTILQVRDGNGVTCIQGEGELYIGSSSRISYLDEETFASLHKPVFRSTGDLVEINGDAVFYKGRTNYLIKKLGHRINLLSISEAVFQETDIPNACVWVEHELKLVLFFQINGFDHYSKGKIIDRLRVKLLHLLPKECFPDSFEIVKNFPLSESGKTDKKALEKIFSMTNHSPAVKQGKPVDLLTLLWCQYFGLTATQLKTYRTNTFNDFGGNSILAMQFLEEFKYATCLDYPSELVTFVFEKSYEDCCNFVSKNSHKFVKILRRSERELCMQEIHNEERVEKLKIKMEIVWEYNLEACVDASPIIIRGSSTSSCIAIGSFAHIFAVINSKNGEEKCKTILPESIESAACISPIKHQIFVGCYDGRMYCIETDTGKIVWNYQTGDRIKCTPCVCLESNAIVFGSYDKYVHCVYLKNGRGIWKTPVGASITSNPLYGETTKSLYVATTLGSCLCLSEETGDILWTYNCSAPVFGSPCLLHFETPCVVWPDVKGNIHCVSHLGGKSRWIFTSNGNVFSSVIEHKGYLLFTNTDKNLYCIEATSENCTLKYNVLMDSKSTTTPSILNYGETTYIIAASTAGSVFVVDFRDGTVLNVFTILGEIFSSPVVNENKIFLGCRNNNVYCISIVSGENKICDKEKSIENR